MGEVAERSEDGEGKPGCNALSVTFGDSSPRGRAKGVCPVIYEKWSVSVPIHSIHCFMTTHQKRVLFFHAKIHFRLSQKAAGHIAVDHGKGRDKQKAVKPVQNSPMPRKNPAEILNSHRPFDR